MAVVLLPLLLLLFGIVEFARVYSTQLRLQHAARETAREIALKHDDPGILDLGIDIGGLAIQKLDELLPGLELEVRELTLCPADGDGDAGVRLAEDVDLVLPLPGDQLGSVRVAANAVMACEA